MGYPEAVTEESVRRRTVLVLRGTGINAWSYYGFLEKFTLEELAQFRRIVGVSGGAAVLWVYALSLVGHFDTATVERYDSIVRGVMNREGIMARAARVFRLRSPYTASQNLSLLEGIVGESAFKWTFDQFPLKNFRVLTAEGDGGYREFGEGAGDGGLPVAPVIAIGGTPLSGQDLKLAGVGGVHFDFEYASGRVRRSYMEHLAEKFPEDKKLILNTRHQSEGDDKEYYYLRLCGDKWPRQMRAFDAVLLFLGLPNRRYLRSFRRSRGEL